MYSKWSLKKKSILRHFAQNHKYLQLEKSTKYCKKRNTWHLWYLIKHFPCGFQNNHVLQLCYNVLMLWETFLHSPHGNDLGWAEHLSDGSIHLSHSNHRLLSLPSMHLSNLCCSATDVKGSAGITRNGCNLHEFEHENWKNWELWNYVIDTSLIIQLSWWL